MKTWPLLVILSVETWSAFGQGLVDFRNGGITFPTEADRRVYSFKVGPTARVPLTGVNFVAGLWYLAGADQGGQIASATQAGQLFTFRPPGTQLPGYWLVPAGVSPLFVLNGVAVGGSATLQVRVWDRVKYGSYEQAVASGELGMSPPFNYTVPVAGSAPDKYYMDNLRAWAFIPEPSTWTLAALVGATLVVVARRNSRKQRSA